MYSKGMTGRRGSDYFEGAEAARERARDQVKAAFDRDPLDQPPTRVCPSCHVESATWRNRCPECDKRYDRRWPWLSDRARWALAGLALLLVGGAVAYAAPKVTESTRGQAARAKAEQNARIARLRTVMIREQKPQFATSKIRDDRRRPDADRITARRALVTELEAAILVDAHSRIAAKRLDGPVKEALCDPLSRAPSLTPDEDDLSKRRGRYDCVAVKRDVVRDGKVIARFGHPFVGTIDFRRGTLVWCRDSRAPGESGKALVKVALDPRCVGVDEDSRLQGGFVAPEE